MRIPAPLIAIVVLTLVICAAYASADKYWESLNLPQDPHALLENILSRQEFVDAREPSLIDRIRTWIFDVLREILAWLFKRDFNWSMPRFDMGGTLMALEGLLIGLAAVAILWAMTKVVGAVLRRKAATGDDSGDGVQAPRTDGDLRALGLNAAERGDYRNALALLFRHVLLQLDRAGKLSVHPGKTNWEIVAAAGDLGPLRDTLAELVRIFNRVFYGAAKCDRSEFDRFLSICERAMGGS